MTHFQRTEYGRNDNVSLPRLAQKKALCLPPWSLLLSHSLITCLRGSQMPSCKNTQGALERNSPGGSLLPTASAGLRPPANSHEWAVRKAVPPATVQSSDNCSPGLPPDYNFMRGHKPKPPSIVIHRFLTLRVIKVSAMKGMLFQTTKFCDSNQ